MIVLRDFDGFLERIHALLQSFLELLNEGNVFLIVKLVLSLLLELDCLIEVKKAFSYVTVLIVRVDFGAFLICLDGFLGLPSFE